MAVTCPGCNLSIEPIRVFEKSTKPVKWWRITKCPRERCGFNIDIESCDKPGTSTNKEKPELDDKGRSFWNGSFWE